MDDPTKPKLLSKKGVEVLQVPGGMIVYRTCFVSGHNQPLHSSVFIPYTNDMKNWVETGDNTEKKIDLSSVDTEGKA